MTTRSSTTKWRRRLRVATAASASLAASLLSAFPLAGQVNLLTTSSFDSPQQLISAGNLARGAALVSLGAAAGQHGDWSVQGAMTQGDVASWMVSGSYLTRAPARHVYDLGMAYTFQRYDGSNPAALAAVADGNRFAGPRLRVRFVDDHAESVAALRRPLREVRLHRAIAVQPARAIHDHADRIAASQRWRVAARDGARRGGIRAVDDRWHLAAARTDVRADLRRDVHAAAHHALRRHRRARFHADHARRRRARSISAPTISS